MADIDTMGLGGKALTLDDQDLLSVHGGVLTLNRGGGGSAVKGAGVQTRSRGFIDLDPLAIGGLLEQLKVRGHW